MQDPSSASIDPAGSSDRYGRTVDLLGPEGFARLRRARVVVVGLGGVGGHAAVALARAGVGCLRVVDFDRVTWSSLNRSAFATPANVGQPKVLALRDHLHALDPSVQVETRECFFHQDTAEEILDDSMDFLIDAIDSVTPKVALLLACHQRGLPVVSCMGASARTDPTALRVSDISETSICPLARVIRKKLRRHGVERGVLTVYSVEPGRAPLPPDEDEDTFRRGRIRRRLPSLGMLPGIFGFAAASLVISELTRAARTELAVPEERE